MGGLVLEGGCDPNESLSLSLIVSSSLSGWSSWCGGGVDPLFGCGGDEE